MIENNSVLAVIPARGGSKGVPRKNVRKVAGRPLIAWTIEEAKKSQYIDRLILSSEDSEIISVSRSLGCEVPFVRPSELSKDDTPGIEPVIHAIQSLPGYDYVALLQPTSPLRKVQDIDGCIELCVSSKASSCVSITLADKSPFWMYTLNGKGMINKFIDNSILIQQRQDLPKVYALNGAVYVCATEALIQNKSFLLTNTVGYIMSKINSIDIDSELDLFVAEQLMLMTQRLTDYHCV